MSARKQRIKRQLANRECNMHTAAQRKFAACGWHNCTTNIFAVQYNYTINESGYILTEVIILG